MIMTMYRNIDKLEKIVTSKYFVLQLHGLFSYSNFREWSKTIAAYKRGKSIQAHMVLSCFWKPILLAFILTET